MITMLNGDVRPRVRDLEVLKMALTVQCLIDGVYAVLVTDKPTYYHITVLVNTEKDVIPLPVTPLAL